MKFSLFGLRFSRRRSGEEIQPEDIFLDDHNLPQFDRHQLEGQFESPISFWMVAAVVMVFMVVGLVFGGRLFTLQVLEGETYLERSESNRLRRSYLFAERGVIYDTHRSELAWNYKLRSNDDFARRQYATTSGLSHLVGYLRYPSKDSSGVYYQENYEGVRGVEKSFDDILAGQNGVKLIEIDAANQVLSENTVRRPQSGQNVHLSIDRELQSQLFKFIKERAEDSGFHGGAGLIMDIRTGQLVAITSYPEYSTRVMVEDDDDRIAEIQERKNHPFLHRAVSGLYIPGSIIKPFLALAALEEGVIDPHTEINSPGTISVQNPYDPEQETVFTDWKAHGWVDMREALAVSSNIYFYEVGGGYKDQPGLGITRINQYMKSFGFGRETGVRLDGEKAGVTPSPEWKAENFEDDTWRLGDTYNAAIGQFGTQVTPIQAVRAAAAIANQGYLLTPKLEHHAADQTTGESTLDIAPTHYQVAKEGMRQAVTDGTASGLDVSYLDIAAKTGTAEIGKKSVNSWVLGFYPYQEPRYAFTVVMEEGPRKNQLGGVWVMRRFFDWLQQNRQDHFRPGDRGRERKEDREDAKD